jgi:hypothetical protein
MRSTHVDHHAGGVKMRARPPQIRVRNVGYRVTDQCRDSPGVPPAGHAEPLVGHELLWVLLSLGAKVLPDPVGQLGRVASSPNTHPSG